MIIAKNYEDHNLVYGSPSFSYDHRFKIIKYNYKNNTRTDL